MHGVDTDVIVRHLTGDDPQQADKARAVIGQTPVVVPRTVLLDVEWVLPGVYDLSPEQVILEFSALAGLVARAMGWAGAGMDTSPTRSIWRLRPSARAS